MRRALRGETFVPLTERLELLGSRPHGHVQAVRLAMQQFGIESLLGSRPSPERDRILALIAARHLGEGSLAVRPGALRFILQLLRGHALSFGWPASVCRSKRLRRWEMR